MTQHNESSAALEEKMTIAIIGTVTSTNIAPHWLAG